MAEAHSAVAFSFTVTPDGYDVRINHEALKAVWESGVVSWKKRIGKLKNNIHNGVFPASLYSWLIVVTIVLAVQLVSYDPSFGFIQLIHLHIPYVNSASSSLLGLYISTIVFGTLIWIAKFLVLKYLLKLLLSYHKWIYEVHGRTSFTTKLWFTLIKLYGGRKPLLMSYQASIPKLPVPDLRSSVNNYLNSVQHLMPAEKYKEVETLADDFCKGVGKKFQRYLILKSWWATNYVSDWWEEYIYLRGRSPIMINSNYYGLDALLVHNTSVQAARAANLIYAMLMYRREVDREELRPILINNVVPLCSAQYERQFNTTRIPGIETDKLVHFKESNHITVYHKGRYFKVLIKHKQRFLKPAELEIIFQKILDDNSAPMEGEEHLAALTAGERIPWAKARQEYFNHGKNKTSLDAIEKAAFCVTFDTEPQEYDPKDPSKLDRYGKAMIHGKGYDRWFDKSFTFVVCSNGQIGFNAEHSWADAPIMAHMWEVVVTREHILLGADAPLMAQTWEACQQHELRHGYDEKGHCLGTPECEPPHPIRLHWEIPTPCIDVIESSFQVATKLMNDLDLHIMMFTEFGKGFVKTCKVSPDAFIQAALQLTYYRMENKFCLTYESSMTRLFREGRTETVRSCTAEVCNFALALNEGKPKSECIKLLNKAAETHQKLYRDTMTGRGVDRHLFCLYVVSKYLDIESPFLSKALSEPWKLSTSQTPHQQTDRLDLNKYPDRICGGGGFGPVTDDGYGVSYIIAGEDTIFFHISCKVSCPHTDSHKFGATLKKSLCDMREMFSKN
ncbi:carnitine O-palmitoyltransferase 1, liver isoform-like isoform X2 [Biomphalaria glabrata]|uniref:carnitine O-palmitoyltransferase n=1 Tax=Biomphalaria glabrata TaxID=6526 RepID=A0A9U8DUK3_BIOGL|nr:carnitine O-palmitoyltransferase 1, liver isoform-like isoform X2 [Biomphalaria glabrata]